LWHNVAFWRPFALASGALAAACIGALIYLGSLSREALLVAELNGNGKHALVATIDPRRATVLAVPANLAVTGDRVPELWLIVPGKDPRALGVIDAQKPVALAIPAHLLAEATSEAALAISLEPPGGSPTGQPTGPVIAVGPLTKL
jgi:anti-sigma-K factor RskA